ncbi:DUF3822 family protein [Lishizhenia sp.]|uniref:DUF3822 family protein n=1 Tax=Lishizhenia sp. TaxID=2497594 RepID=UPI00299DBD00|nr:DUF3822 family protein [Lishizhenia sp.]MDX1444991.1 DUF3822 family protein [Lishizhenia sp.]
MSTQLCINITGTSAHFAEVLRSSEEVVEHYHLEFSSYVEEEIKTELLTFIHANNLRRDFDEVSLAYWSNTYTLVPFNLIDSKNYTDAFTLCFGEGFSKNEIDYNMLPQLGISSIFHLPSWIKSFFIVKYPRIVIQHAATLFLRGMNQANSFKPTVEIEVNDQHFYLNIFVHGELKFSNAFEYNHVNDIVYHSLLVLQKLEISKENGEISLSALNAKIDLTELKETFTSIQELSKIQIEIKEHQYIKHHLLCV